MYHPGLEIPGYERPKEHVPSDEPVRDPEPQRNNVPIREHSPTPARTKPFFPARRVPERAPVQHVPMSTVHDAQIELPPTRLTNPAPEQPKTLMPVKQKELTPVKEKPFEKITGNLTNPPQNDNFSLNFSPPSFRSKLTKKFKFHGRRGRQRTNAEVIELLTFVQTKGVWPREISDQMQRYYKREYPEYFRNRKARGKRPKVYA